MIPSSDLPTVSGDHRCVYRTDAEVVRAGNERLEARCQELEENGVVTLKALVKAEAERDKLDGLLDQAEAENERLREALRTIAFCLTTAEGDNIPRGEAAPLMARTLARNALDPAGVTGEESREP